MTTMTFSARFRSTMSVTNSSSLRKIPSTILLNTIEVIEVFHWVLVINSPAHNLANLAVLSKNQVFENSSLIKVGVLLHSARIDRR